MANVLFVLFILILDVVSDDNRCLLFNGGCVPSCPRNMHPYHTRCEIDTLSQRTCDDPHVYTLGYTCGWSRCDCNGELLLDERTQSCVDIFTCNTEWKGKIKNRRRPGVYKLPKKLHLQDDDTFPI